MIKLGEPWNSEFNIFSMPGFCVYFIASSSDTYNHSQCLMSISGKKVFIQLTMIINLLNDIVVSSYYKRPWIIKDYISTTTTQMI